MRRARRATAPEPTESAGTRVRDGRACHRSGRESVGYWSSLRLSRCGFKGKTASPEFLREGAAIRDFKFPDRIVIGTPDERGRKALGDIYRPLSLNQAP